MGGSRSPLVNVPRARGERGAERLPSPAAGGRGAGVRDRPLAPTQRHIARLKRRAYRAQVNVSASPTAAHRCDIPPPEPALLDGHLGPRYRSRERSPGTATRRGNPDRSVHRPRRCPHPCPSPTCGGRGESTCSRRAVQEPLHSASTFAQAPTVHPLNFQQKDIYRTVVEADA